jgi:uncharacterized membrane protein
MDLTHLHLLLNHVPTVGMIIALGLFVLALVAKRDHLLEASLVLLLGVALVTIPTYVTGNAAAQRICRSPGPNAPCQDPTVLRALIEAHEGAAMPAMFMMEFVGAFAWLGLWQYRRARRVPAWNLTIILILSLVTFAAVAKAANLGGDIRHPEIRDAGDAPGRPLGRELGSFVVSTKWVWPTCETLHFVGLSLLFGVAALVDLRMLGMLKKVPYHALHRMMPWGILGYGMNTLTGMLFFIGAPQQYTQNTVFKWKMALILLAGLNVVYFTIFDEPWRLGPGESASPVAKFVAATALVLVVGVLYCGRMLPFLGNAF